MTADPVVEQDEMSFGEHLEDLRKRLIHALIGIAVVACGTFYYGDQIILLLQTPLHHAQREAGLPPMTIGLSVTTGFAVYMKVSIVSAGILASPWVIYQIWQFVAVGLYASERKAAMLLMPFSALMTVLGLSFTYFIMLPVCLAFLINFSTSYPEAPAHTPTIMDSLTRNVAKYAGKQSEDLLVEKPTATGEQIVAADEEPATLPVLLDDPAEPAEGQFWINRKTGELKVHFTGRTRVLALTATSLMSPFIEIGEYLGFVMFLNIGVVVAFQLPLIMLIVGWTGAIDPAFVAKSRRYCVFICFVLGAFLTPADPISMVVLAVPLWMLFELGLLLMRITAKKIATDEELPSGDGG